MKKFTWFNATALTFGFAFLYLPMVILVIYSFNASKLVTVWAGFSTKWYGRLLENEAFLDAAWVTLKVGFISSTLATVLGTLAAYVLIRAGRIWELVTSRSRALTRGAAGDRGSNPAKFVSQTASLSQCNRKLMYS